MAAYLRPDTLFGPKFESYLEQSRKAQPRASPGREPFVTNPAEYFRDNPPCRTTVEVSSLPTPIAIELKCIATVAD